MQVIFPRLLGALLLSFVPFIATTRVEPAWLPLVVACAWLVPVILLLTGQHVQTALVFVVFLGLGGYVLDVGGDDFFPWISGILLMTQGHPHERALLLRVMVSVVYSFAVLAKLNPAWLAGEQIAVLGGSVPHLAPFEPILLSSWGRLVAVGVLLIEAWLAIGLWFRRTRVPTALLGVMMHVGLTVAAAGSLRALFDLVPLNFGLLAMYLAFWYPPAPDVAAPSGTLFGRSLTRLNDFAIQ